MRDGTGMMKFIIMLCVMIAGCGGVISPETGLEGPTGNVGPTGEGVTGPTGRSGQSCTVKQNTLGVLITCPDGSSAFISVNNKGARHDHK